jgi:hypothetical protein
VHQLRGEPALIVAIEIGVLNQERQLERRAFGQLGLALAFVAYDPPPREPGVYVVLGDAHDVIVVPEQRRALIVRVVEHRALARREQVLGPAVVRRGRQPAVKVHDCMTGERGRVLVGVPPLSPGTHSTGTPVASVASGAIVTRTGSGASSSLRHSTVTGCPRSVSIVGPGTVPSKPDTGDSGKSR